MADPVSTQGKSRRRGRRLLVLASAGALLASVAAYVITEAAPSFAATSANVWLTTADQSNKLTQKPAVTFGTSRHRLGHHGQPEHHVPVHRRVRRSMTDASANNIWNSSARNTIMSNLFGSGGIGLSFLRQPIGTSDFSVQFYSLDDGAADPNLTRFSISRDQSYIVPLLQQAKSLNPGLSVMGSPWSAPGWMKNQRQHGWAAA